MKWVIRSRGGKHSEPYLPCQVCADEDARLVEEAAEAERQRLAELAANKKPWCTCCGLCGKKKKRKIHIEIANFGEGEESVKVDNIRVQGDIAVFRIVVIASSGEEWFVWVPFTDFTKLKKKLKKQGANAPASLLLQFIFMPCCGGEGILRQREGFEPPKLPAKLWTSDKRQLLNGKFLTQVRALIMNVPSPSALRQKRSSRTNVIDCLCVCYPQRKNGLDLWLRSVWADQKCRDSETLREFLLFLRGKMGRLRMKTKGFCICFCVWKKRWFVAEGKTLKVYKNKKAFLKDEENVLLTYPLDDLTVFEGPKHKKKLFLLVGPNDDYEINLIGKNPADVEHWIDVLRKMQHWNKLQREKEGPQTPQVDMEELAEIERKLEERARERLQANLKNAEEEDEEDIEKILAGEDLDEEEEEEEKEEGAEGVEETSMVEVSSLETDEDGATLESVDTTKT